MHFPSLQEKEVVVVEISLYCLMSCEDLSNWVFRKEVVLFVSPVQSAHISCFVRLVFEKMLSVFLFVCLFYLDVSVHEWEAGLSMNEWLYGCMLLKMSTCSIETSLQHAYLFLNRSDSVVLLI